MNDPIDTAARHPGPVTMEPNQCDTCAWSRVGERGHHCYIFERKPVMPCARHKPEPAAAHPGPVTVEEPQGTETAVDLLREARSAMEHLTAAQIRWSGVRIDLGRRIDEYLAAISLPAACEQASAEECKRLATILRAIADTVAPVPGPGHLVRITATSFGILADAADMLDRLATRAQGAAPAVPQDDVMDMALCEAHKLVLRVGQPYRFTPMPGCASCEAAMREAVEAYGPTGGAPTPDTKESA